MSAPTESRPHSLRLEGRSIDEAEAIGSAVFHPHRVHALAPGPAFRLGIDAVSAGAVTVGTIEYTRPARIETGAYEDSYHVNIALEGDLRTAIGSERVVARSTRAALYRRDVPTIIEGFERGARVLAVKVARDALDSRLRLLGGSPGAGGIAFGGRLDMATGWGREWRWYVDLFARQLTDPGILVEHPLLAAAVQDAVLDGLLRCAEYPGAPDDAPPTATRTTVSRIADLMSTSPELHYGSELLAELSGTTPRAVQQGFRRQFGVTPHEFLRIVRLERVRSELTDPTASASIATIARRWGFAHIGRFSADYAHRFGELPSETLRQTVGGPVDVRNAKPR